MLSTGSYLQMKCISAHDIQSISPKWHLIVCILVLPLKCSLGLQHNAKPRRRVSIPFCASLRMLQETTEPATSTSGCVAKDPGGPCCSAVIGNSLNTWINVSYTETLVFHQVTSSPEENRTAVRFLGQPTAKPQKLSTIWNQKVLWINSCFNYKKKL